MTSATPHEKTQALATLAVQLVNANDPSKDVLNRLFFAARNLAIQTMLLELSMTLRRRGFPAECEWLDGAPAVLQLRMLNESPRGGWTHGTCRVLVERSAATGPDCLSDRIYAAQSFDENEYWAGRQPAKLMEFRAAVREMWEAGTLQQHVLNLNYPFDYHSYSSC